VLFFEGVLDRVVQNRNRESCECLGHDEDALGQDVRLFFEFLDVCFEQRQLVLVELAVVDVQPFGLVGFDQVQDGGLDARLVRLVDLAQGHLKEFDLVFDAFLLAQFLEDRVDIILGL